MARRVALCAVPVVALLLGGCASGKGGATPKSTPKAAAPTPAPTPAPPPGADQSIAVARQIFPVAFDGGYLECDAIATEGYDTTNCPMSSRLRTQVARYAANYHQQCPHGCGGALPIIRDHCGSFPDETVTVGQTQSIAIARLSGDATCRGVAKTFYVVVVIENDQAVADDIYCGVADPKYGMYNRNKKATGPPPCPA